MGGSDVVIIGLVVEQKENTWHISQKLIQKMRSYELSSLQKSTKKTAQNGVTAF
jgi:hypothetical protein